MGLGTRVVMVLAALVVVVAGMRLAAPILLPVLFATFLAIVTAPMIAAMTRRRVPGWLAVVIAVTVDLGALLAAATLLVTSVASFDKRLPEYQARLTTLVHDVSAWLQARGLDGFARESEVFDPSALLGTVTTVLRGAAGLVSNLFLVFVVLVFILVEATGLRRKVALLSSGSSAPATRIGGGARQMQQYLLVKGAASLVTGLLAGLWVWILGVDLPLVWGLLAFVLNFVPAIGSVIAAVPPALVALLMGGPASAALVAGGYLAINMAIGNFIEPRILGRALGLSPLVVLLSVIFWGFVLGPAGALLSIPLTVVLKILFSTSDDLRWLSVLLGPSPAEEPGQAPAAAEPPSGPSGT